jgi:hypothetical protein
MKTDICISIYSDDAKEYKDFLYKEYKSKGETAADLFQEMLQAYKDKKAEIAIL